MDEHVVADMFVTRFYSCVQIHSRHHPRRFRHLISARTRLDTETTDVVSVLLRVHDRLVVVTEEEAMFVDIVARQLELASDIDAVVKSTIEDVPLGDGRFDVRNLVTIIRATDYENHDDDESAEHIDATQLGACIVDHAVGLLLLLHHLRKWYCVQKIVVSTQLRDP